LNAQEQYNIGGSPEQNAALAVIMFAACAAPYSGNTVDERLHAASVMAGLPEAAEAGGFTARDEFLHLVGTNAMSRPNKYVKDRLGPVFFKAPVRHGGRKKKKANPKIGLSP